MKKEEIIVDGEKMEIIVELTEEEKDDTFLSMEKTDILEENTLDLTEVLNTQKEDDNNG